MSSRETYKFTAKVLALGMVSNNPSLPGNETHPGQNTALNGIIDAIVSNRINWKELVYIASNNFILQTLYLKFCNHNLSGLLPGDLTDHLQNIYWLNLERNRNILDQCSRINSLLKSHGITPVFMKGAGNMLDGLYPDQGERIMADIDILTGPGHMEDAARLLMQEGYTSHETFNRSKTAALKHYPVLWCEGLPACVEIHRLPVNIQYSSHFDYQTVKNEIRPATSDPAFTVMSDTHKIILSFYHSQLVHWGHQHARPSLRELYDLLLLSGREDPARIFSSLRSHRGKAAGYLKAMYRTFGITSDLPPALKGKGRVFLLRHKIAINKPEAGKVIYTLLRAWRLYADIPLRSLFSRNYRLYVRVRLRDPEWYKRNLGIDWFREKTKKQENKRKTKP